MDLTDPQQAHGYTYGSNNPLLYTDPSGQMQMCGEGGAACYPGGWNNDGTTNTDCNRSSNDTYKTSSSCNSVSTVGGGGGSSGGGGGSGASGYGGQLAADGSRTIHFNVGAGPDRGVIVARFFIHTQEAAMGMLLGDDRGFTDDPASPYRMKVVRNTATGDVTFTITPSRTTGRRIVEEGGLGNVGKPRMIEGDSATIPVDPIYLNSSESWKTVFARNIINGDGDANGLNLSIDAVNSLMSIFSVDGDFTIRFTEKGTYVTRLGGAYPDMEVYQYQSGQTMRTLATDSMAHSSGAVNGLDAAPIGFSKINKVWRYGTCVVGC